ncbi:hypothetical protein Ddye_023908 [Dipteronia dyeriana]|uniref:Uncharacterized protein n=1 Tax=Dipteronia dyeriana TaxID=168575 RepID=A0AAD9TUS5_9ROSI|nr:hypothetical protein Ddye_023908 [Dipteronia dyeriana]
MASYYSLNKLCWLAFLVLSCVAVAVHSSSAFDSGFDRLTSMGQDEELFEDNEMLFDTDSTRRQLKGGSRYISYGALKANQVPCNKRGHSYYNCQRSKKANPYTRGCSAITKCKRYTK